MRREGNNADIANLKDTFEMSRGCIFKDLKSPTKEELFKILSSEDEINKLTGIYNFNTMKCKIFVC
jgi:hypothetical protein